ncbi:MAG: diacylglycerol kinase family protein [Ruminococcus sp.]|nr:diacylglycerol kinase family protein [Ruminococcus sp.]
MIHILYNPKSNCGKDFENVLNSVKDYYKNEEQNAVDITTVEDTKALFDTFDDSDDVVLVGGDGTLNVLCNNLRGYDIKNRLFLFKAGSGNDFLRDVELSLEGDDAKVVQINEYINNLPVVTVKGKEYLFVNNVGYGIDGKVCTAAEDERAKGKKEINYTTLAIKLLLTSYKSNGAKVTVDGVTKEFKKVWLAPVMNGLFYGGGMMPAPQQNRKGDSLSCCVIHSTNAIQTLIIFPSLFKGEHIKYKKKVEVMSGREIKVEFDAPQDVQIDGEIIRDVTEISAKKFADLKLRDAEV